MKALISTWHSNNKHRQAKAASFLSIFAKGLRSSPRAPALAAPEVGPLVVRPAWRPVTRHSRTQTRGAYFGAPTTRTRTIRCVERHACFLLPLLSSFPRAVATTDAPFSSLFRHKNTTRLQMQCATAQSKEATFGGATASSQYPYLVTQLCAVGRPKAVHTLCDGW